MNRRTMTKLPLFATLAGVTGLAAASPAEESAGDHLTNIRTRRSEAMRRAKTLNGTPAQRIERARVFLDFLNEHPEEEALDALWFATSEGNSSKLSSEMTVENAKEYLGFLTA